ncbi:Importin subunit beta, partial [Fragariocoptes setiger]
MDLKAVLLKTISPIQEELVAASKFIENYVQQDFAGFLRALADILHNAQNEPVARMAAGLQLKIQLTARDEATRQQRQQRWCCLTEDVRRYIKERVFGALGTETTRTSSAAQCVAYIALAELPHKLWPDVINLLCHSVTRENATESLRQAALEAIGYICAEIDPCSVEVSDANLILTAIVHGARDGETNNFIRLAATTALLNSLEFTQKNFENEHERNVIMEVVCKATQCQDLQVRVAALQCLVKIMSLYYQYMESYMANALFAITLHAMRSDNDDVALQGIEFWSNVCDEEIQLAMMAAEAAETGSPPTRTSKHYARGALQYLVSDLVEMLARQDEADDTEDWKPCKAAGVCLMLLANCCENAIVAQVIPFIEANIQSPDWRRRDAAVMAFGSILEGPDTQTLKPFAEKIVPCLIQFMTDESVVVRDTSAWAIGKLCDTVPEAVLSQQFLPVLIEALVNNINVDARVAYNVCWAVNSLVAAAGESARDACAEDAAPATFQLSVYLPRIVQELLVVTDRRLSQQQQQSGGNNPEQNLKTAAYEALREVIKSAPNDCYQLVYPQTLNVMLDRIQYIVSQASKIDNITDMTHYYDLQSFLWATMTAIIRRMNNFDVVQESDRIMGHLLATLAHPPPAASTAVPPGHQAATSSQSSTTGDVTDGQLSPAALTESNLATIQEDAFNVVSALLDSITTHFMRYMDAFKPYLIAGLRNTQSVQVVITAIGLLGDLSRALGMELFPHCQDFMNVLVHSLADNAFDRNAKPYILTTFGDFALAFGRHFEPWVNVSITMLQHASTIQVDDTTDLDLVDYCTKLRECAIEGYTGIIQGLKGTDSPSPEANDHVKSLLLPHMPHAVQFLIIVSQDPTLSDSLICSCCGLVGDIAETFGASVAPLLNQPAIIELLARGRRTRNEKTHSIANWAHQEIRKLSRAAQNIAAAGVQGSGVPGAIATPAGGIQ